MPQKSHIYMYLIAKGEEYMYVSQKYKYVQQRGNRPTQNAVSHSSACVLLVKKILPASIHPIHHYLVAIGTD